MCSCQGHYITVKAVIDIDRIKIRLMLHLDSEFRYLNTLQVRQQDEVKRAKFLMIQNNNLTIDSFNVVLQQIFTVWLNFG